MKKQWWHDKIAYQIYPKSFYDTNGDGIGDVRGVIEKLDYLRGLGVDILWLSPIYRSPLIDQGYDIADYYAICEQFGTMEDMDRLLTEAKRRQMYVVMDLVVNHCSDQHEWFRKALADPYGPYADYFYFRPGKNGGAPCNYRSYFGGSAWEPVPGTELYYLHYFAKQQPDLNWENPAMRAEIYKMINWWLDKGLAGFRIDAIMNIKKDLSFADLPADGPDGLASVHHAVEKAEGVGALLEDLKAHTFAPHAAFTVGEVFDMRADELPQFIGDDGHFSTIFDFSAVTCCEGAHGWYDAPPFDVDRWRDAVFAQQKRSEDVGMMANIIENHDEPRGVSRILPEYAQNPAGKKMLGTISVLLRGLPFLYQGQEIGMTNCPMTSIDECDDISTRNEYAVARAAGLSDAQAMRACQRFSRDNARTPMQWSDAPQAGFTAGTPWLHVNPNYRTINVAAEQADPYSVLCYYQKLLALRQSDAWHSLFVGGSTVPVGTDRHGLFAYERRGEGRRVLVAANLLAQSLRLPLDGMPGDTLLDNLRAAARVENGALVLDSCEAAVLALR